MQRVAVDLLLNVYVCKLGSHLQTALSVYKGQQLMACRQ